MKPERIGKYEILAKIGQGAMGEVFRGHDPVLDRDVAVKRITAALDADETVRKRFEREARAAANLGHPRIVKVYELGTDGEQQYMAMELLEGDDLKRVLARGGLRLEAKLALVEQVLEGLAYAHSKGVVHRDLKPANIHVDARGEVKIMDFGLARLSGSEMTATGMVMGTPHYMSPEQVRGQKADARSDVFAVGCVFYELVTSRKPFDAESLHAVLFKVMQEEPPPLRELAPDTPEAVAQVIDQALSKNPAERFPDAAEMLQALRRARQAVASGRGHERAAEPARPAPMTAPAAAATSASRSGSRSHSRPPRAPSGSRAPLVIGVAIGLVLLVAAALGLRTFLGRQSAAASPPPQVETLARAVIDTQVELARRRLDGLDFEDASRQAERALKLDPQNAEARAILERAAAAQREVEQALAALRGAGADRERTADAALGLMRLVPSHPEAERAAAAAGAVFRSRAEQARGLAAEARRDAEQRGASGRPAFEEASSLEKQAERALAAGRAPEAARGWLEARLRYERAGR